MNNVPDCVWPLLRVPGGLRDVTGTCLCSSRLADRVTQPHGSPSCRDRAAASTLSSPVGTEEEKKSKPNRARSPGPRSGLAQGQSQSQGEGKQPPPQSGRGWERATPGRGTQGFGKSSPAGPASQTVRLLEETAVYWTPSVGHSVTHSANIYRAPACQLQGPGPGRGLEKPQ